jgi:hypothetical protein
MIGNRTPHPAAGLGKSGASGGRLGAQPNPLAPKFKRPLEAAATPG